jgi:hypothetical protein
MASDPSRNCPIEFVEVPALYRYVVPGTVVQVPGTRYIYRYYLATGSLVDRASCITDVPVRRTYNCDESLFSVASAVDGSELLNVTILPMDPS